MSKIHYWRRIFKVYLTRNKGYLNFWHEFPEGEDINCQELGLYYMTFSNKAVYNGPRDDDGVILFDYYGDIGRQYNPIAIAQYGLAHHNLYLKNQKEKHLLEAKRHADWLVRNLKTNKKGIFVWRHEFHWHYKKMLNPGWYSALAQGMGISLLVRMYKITGDELYKETAKRAFTSLETDICDGGVKYTDEKGNIWLEEYIVDPPTHILNGFLWTLWGVWDYHLAFKDEISKKLFFDSIITLKTNIGRYDTGFWSLYDLSKQILKMIASPFYHHLHIVQLKVMYEITKESFFKEYAEKFESYKNSKIKRARALFMKILFKLFYF